MLLYRAVPMGHRIVFISYTPAGRAISTHETYTRTWYFCQIDRAFGVMLISWARFPRASRCSIPLRGNSPRLTKGRVPRDLPPVGSRVMAASMSRDWGVATIC